jgi:hypothetical protein
VDEAGGIVAYVELDVVVHVWSSEVRSEIERIGHEGSEAGGGLARRVVNGEKVKIGRGRRIGVEVALRPMDSQASVASVDGAWLVGYSWGHE